MSKTFKYGSPAYWRDFNESMNRQAKERMYHASCDECSKPLGAYIDENGNDGSINILCAECFKKE